MVPLQLKDPLELFVKRREFLRGSRFLSRRDMTKAVDSDVKPNSFLPSLHVGTIHERRVPILFRNWDTNASFLFTSTAYLRPMGEYFRTTKC